MWKPIKVVILTVVWVMSVLFFTGCSKENMVNDSLLVQSDGGGDQFTKKVFLTGEFSEYGLKAYPKGIITYEDFKATGKLLTLEEAEQLLEEKKLGEKPDNAVVGLIFHANGNLCTPHEFNSSEMREDFLVNGNENYQGAVSLKTFQEVTGLKEATGDYARDFGVFWVFDPYVKFYETRAERELLMQKRNLENMRSSSRSLSTYQEYLKTGNILYGEWQWWSPAGYTGHTAGIVNSPDLSTMCYSGDSALRQINVVEAMPSTGVVRHCPIYTSGGSNDWSASNMSKRYVIYTTIEPSSLEREKLKEFQENQLGKEWKFPALPWQARTNKEKTKSFYCSKLQWLAYKKVMNLDLDRDAGDWVFPRDILYDNDVSYIAFGYGVLT